MKILFSSLWKNDFWTRHDIVPVQTMQNTRIPNNLIIRICTSNDMADERCFSLFSAKQKEKLKISCVFLLKFFLKKIAIKKRILLGVYWIIGIVFDQCDGPTQLEATLLFTAQVCRWPHQVDIFYHDNLVFLLFHNGDLMVGQF